MRRDAEGLAFHRRVSWDKAGENEANLGGFMGEKFRCHHVGIPRVSMNYGLC